MHVIGWHEEVRRYPTKKRSHTCPNRLIGEHKFAYYLRLVPHNPKVIGSNPISATKSVTVVDTIFNYGNFFLCLKLVV